MNRPSSVIHRKTHLPGAEKNWRQLFVGELVPLYKARIWNVNSEHVRAKATHRVSYTIPELSGSFSTQLRVRHPDTRLRGRLPDGGELYDKMLTMVESKWGRIQAPPLTGWFKQTLEHLVW